MSAHADLIESHVWIVEHFRGRYQGVGRQADLRAAGWHGLCEAAAKFDPRRGRAFSTYAWNWVKGYMLAEMRRSHVVVVPEHTARKAMSEGAPVRGVVVFGLPDFEVEDEQERQSDRAMRLRAVRAVIAEIEDPAVRDVVSRVLRGESCEQIAAELGLTQPRVAALLEAGERELRELMG